MKIETVLAIIFVGACSVVSAGKVADVLYDKMALNKRGWIGCEDGIMIAKDIDIMADTFDMPEGHYVFDLDGRYCKQRAPIPPTAQHDGTG